MVPGRRLPLAFSFLVAHSPIPHHVAARLQHSVQRLDRLRPELALCSAPGHFRVGLGPQPALAAGAPHFPADAALEQAVTGPGWIVGRHVVRTWQPAADSPDGIWRGVASDPRAGGDGTKLVHSAPRPARPSLRSEEHTSELQSLRHLVCRLLLEKK